MEQAQKLKIVESIIQSKEFEASERLKQLLKYLVNAHIDGETLKEVTIASDVFSKGGHVADIDSTTVRSSMYQLRKKLSNYYSNEGINDKYRLIIPKGHYQVKFILNESSASSIPQKNLKYIYSGFSILLLSLIIIIIFVQRIQINQSKMNEVIDHPVWNDIEKSNSPILLVFADGFCFREYNEDLKRTRRIQDFEVQSAEELNKYPFYNKKSIYLEHFSIIGHCVIPNLMRLIPPLQTTGKKIQYKLSSELTWRDLADNNVIYIGPPQSLNVLQSLFELTSFDYLYFGDAEFPPKSSSNNRTNYFFLKNSKEDSLISYRQDYITPYEKYRIEHAVIVKMPNPKGNNTIYIFSGFNFIIRTGAVTNFTNINFLKKLENSFLKKYNKMPPYFETLIEVGGFPQTPTDTNILYFNEIKPTFKH